jgi:threonine synthase
MGNIAGGYMAKNMGVPLGMLCAGTNVNDITYRVMKTGEFRKSEAMQKTLSDAINIQVVRCCDFGTFLANRLQSSQPLYSRTTLSVSCIISQMVMIHSLKSG